MACWLHDWREVTRCTDNNWRIVSLLQAPGSLPWLSSLQPWEEKISDNLGVPSHSLFPGELPTHGESKWEQTSAPSTSPRNAFKPGALTAHWRHSFGMWKMESSRSAAVSAKKSLCSQGLWASEPRGRHKMGGEVIKIQQLMLPPVPPRLWNGASPISLWCSLRIWKPRHSLWDAEWSLLLSHLQRLGAAPGKDSSCQWQDSFRLV